MRLLGSLMRESKRQAVFYRVLPTNTSKSDIHKARNELRHLVENIGDQSKFEVVLSDDPLVEICTRADKCDLLVLGVQRVGRDKKLLGQFTKQVAMQTTCPILIASRRG